MENKLHELKIYKHYFDAILDDHYDPGCAAELDGVLPLAGNTRKRTKNQNGISGDDIVQALLLL